MSKDTIDRETFNTIMAGINESTTLLLDMAVACCLKQFGQRAITITKADMEEVSRYYQLARHSGPHGWTVEITPAKLEAPALSTAAKEFMERMRNEGTSAQDSGLPATDLGLPAAAVPGTD